MAFNGETDIGERIGGLMDKIVSKNGISSGFVMNMPEHNKYIVRLGGDGTIEIGEDYTPTEAGEAFINALYSMGFTIKRFVNTEIVCFEPGQKQYSCIICNTKIHMGDSGCPCSTLRKEQFDYASLCVKCAAAFDRLMNDEELKPIVTHLMHKSYWQGNGPVIDF